MEQMNNLETKNRILETIDLMGNKEVPEVMRNYYHDEALKLLTEYKGKDYDELVNKYLKQEWRK